MVLDEVPSDDSDKSINPYDYPPWEDSDDELQHRVMSQWSAKSTKVDQHGSANKAKTTCTGAEKLPAGSPF